MAMSIQYCSDLHLEFDNNSKHLNKYPLIPSAEILLLGGDIVPFAQMNHFAAFFDWVSENFRAAYWIPGNHEYYHSDINERSGTLNETIRNNVFLVNNVTIDLGVTDLICSTLWSHIDTVNEWQIRRAMSDFHVIADGGGKLTIDRFNQLHAESVQFVQKALAASKNQRKVVLTHHVPTFINYPPKYKNDVLNEAFATELHDLIQTMAPDCWIFGHTHYNTPAFKIGNTQILTNQFGYVKYGEHNTFVRDRVIELETTAIKTM